MAHPRIPTLQYHYCSLVLLLLLLLLLPHGSNQLEYSQFQALVRIKQQLNYPQELSRWTENQDFCNTEPTQLLTLACYEDNITQLHLTGNQWFPKPSQGFSIPALFANLAALPTLKVLSLVSLGLTGPLPPEIGGLSSLEILNLTSNSLSGPIPRQVLSMRNLQTLILDYNGFTGNLPEWIGFFPELRVMSLKNNSLIGSFPNALSRMETLRTLALSGNNLSGQLPGLQSLTNLQLLDLGNNNLGPKFPALPTKLVSLILGGNKFHSVVSDELNSSYQLQMLDISQNQLVGPFPSSILALPSLTYLDIGGNKFNGKLLQNMSCGAQLKLVNLSENRLTGDLPDCLHHTAKDRIVMYDGNCLSKAYRHQNPLPFCHSEALAVGISPRKQRERRPYKGKILASSIVGGVAGASVLLGVAFLFVKRELRKQNQDVNEVPHTRLIKDKVSPAYTLQLLKDASISTIALLVYLDTKNSSRDWGCEGGPVSSYRYSPRHILELSENNRYSAGQRSVLVIPQLSVSLTVDALARRNIVDPAVHKECSDDSVRTLIELCIRCLSNKPSERPSIEDVLWNMQFAAQVQDTWIRDSSSSNHESPLHTTP